MQDMRPPNDRSIRNIPVPQGHRVVRPTQARAPVHQQTEQPLYEEDVTNQPNPRPKRRMPINNRFWMLLGAVVAVCVAVGILMSTFFAGATITVVPRSATVTAPASLTAVLNASGGALVYQVISTSRTASTTVSANGSGQVSKSASGPLTIYNAFSTTPQDLVANTRFASPDGKIYRVHVAVSVPGATKAADGSLTPGMVTVTAYADEPGASYNKSATQFTIPGFKGTAKYTKFYASAPAMSDGFVGVQPTVAPADLTSAENALSSGLKGALESAVATQIPKEYTVIPNTVSISYADVIQTPANTTSASLSQSATASAYIVRTNDLASAIARQTIQGYSGEAVGFVDATKLSIALASTTPTPGSLQLVLSGSPTLVWQFDPTALQKALIGKPKSQFDTILKTFTPAIICSTDSPCKASIRPFWSSTFPSDASKIKVVTGN